MLTSDEQRATSQRDRNPDRSRCLAAELRFRHGEPAVETTADHNAGEDASAHLKSAVITERWRPRRH